MVRYVPLPGETNIGLVSEPALSYHTVFLSNTIQTTQDTQGGIHEPE